MTDPLLALVTSNARARVLTAFFAQPGVSYYQQQLARELRLPLLAVQRELRRLVAAEILNARQVAGRRLYQADRDSAIYLELHSIILKLRGAAAVLRDALEAEPVRLAWVFGSFADGTAGAGSDIDLMVVGDARPRSVRNRLSSAERALGRSVNEHVLTAHEWVSRLAKNDRFIAATRDGPKVWVRGDERALVALAVRAPR